jgi:uncharacterized protein
MSYTFSAKGHPNIMAMHRNTLEITKDAEISKKGDCIIAVSADFSLEELQKLLSSGNCEKISLTITAAGITEKITAIANKKFSSNHEIVFRTGSFLSERTLGTRADKSAAMLDRRLVEAMKNGATATTILTTFK